MATSLLPGLGGGTGGVQLAPGQLANSSTAPMAAQNVAAATASGSMAVPASAPLLSAPGAAQVPAVLPTPQIVNPNANFNNTIQGAAGTPVQQPNVPGTSMPASSNVPQTLPTPQTNSMQTGANGALPAGLTPMSITQLMNQPALPTATDNAIKYGTAATPPGKSNETADKYNSFFDAKKGTEAPSTNPMRDQTTQDALKESTKQDTPDPVAQAMDAYAGMNPVVKSLFDNINHLLSQENTRTSLVDEFKKMTADEGIQEDKLALINIKNVMDGSADDIRSEISKTGGFATESQVMALTGARNKTLLKQASSLQDTINAKEDYVKTIMTLTQADREAVDKQVSQQIGLDEKIAEMTISMDKAAQDNYKSVISKNGFQGLYAALQGNPTAIHAAEKSLGLPSGALAQEAAMEKASDKKLQFVSATTTQPAGFADTVNGTFTPLGGGYGGGGGSGGGGGTGPNASLVNQVVQNIRQSVSNPTKAQLAVIDSIASNPNPLAVITNKVEDIMGQTNATKIQNQIKAQSALDSLKSQLDQYYAKGGKTDLFRGNMQYVADKLGQVTDPKLVEIATQLQATIQTYRNAISGTAYSVQESNDINNIFPGIDKSQAWNEAVLAGRRRQTDTEVASTYDHILGAGMYEALLQAYGPGQTHKPGDIITNNNQQYKVGADGETITPIGSNVDFSSGVSMTSNNPIFGSGKSFF